MKRSAAALAACCGLALLLVRQVTPMLSSACHLNSRLDM